MGDTLGDPHDFSLDISMGGGYLIHIDLQAV